MKTTDLFEEMYLGVTANKIRSGLTMLGIVIGIASVIALLAVGQGAKNQIESNIQSIGSNLLMVLPGAPRGAGQAVSQGRGNAQTLTADDAKALIGLPGVDAVAPESSRRFQIVATGKNTNTQVIGTSPDYPKVRNVSVAEGTFFGESQVSGRARVAVLGPTTRDDLFGAGADAIGKTIRIGGTIFTVIGVTAAKGGSGFSNADDVVLVPLSTLQAYLSGGDSVGTISVQAAGKDAMATAQANVTAALLERHKIPSPDRADFSVLNQTDLAAAASSATDTLAGLLASIAGISLLVGGIGIMNMMLTTVTERTREIGLRQAIGAEKGEIVGQFLGEAVLLTVFGGAAGIGLGFGASRLAGNLLALPTEVTRESVLLALGVSAGIGLVFGFYPARRAAKLNPIQALKYE